MRQAFLVFLTIISLLMPSQVLALGGEDILNILNGASTLGGTGRDWSGTGAAFAPPVLIANGIPTIGSFHELSVGENAEVVLFIGDPENRARWVEWEITELSGEIIESGEVDCQDMTIARIPIVFDQSGLYYMAFYLTSKVRGQQRFIIPWNTAIQRNTDTSQMLIVVNESSTTVSPYTEVASENNSGIYLINSGVNFGSAPRYFVSGLSNFQVYSDNPTTWRVNGPTGLQTFENETFFNLSIKSGSWTFEANGDQMTIHVFSGPSVVEATSDSNQSITYNENEIEINLSVNAHAYAESNPIYIIGVGESILKEVDSVGWSNYYPIDSPIFRVGIPQNQIVHWYWDQDTQYFQEDPTCGPPPSDWGWEPPVPPPPSNSWSPEVPAP